MTIPTSRISEPSCSFWLRFRASALSSSSRCTRSAVSTTAINVVAQNFGNTAGFMAIAAVALAAVAVQWAWMPETKQPYPVQRPPMGFGVQGSTT
jgi:predicted MFS family arabinose efflux permease